ncbi:MAG TPA: HD domain-containing phosphohydrolase, partial [Gemmatimonadales bacterium]|nr:HD domain-containing phosphohydrolase [Gemmatimonadales bacterium]
MAEPFVGRAGATTPERVRLSEVVSALSHALDVTEGQPMGHAVRSTLIGMRIAGVLGVSAEQRSALYYALLLKDLGCSSNASRLTALFGADDILIKHAHKLTEWTATRSEARFAFKYALPGKSRMAKAWHTLMLGSREKGSGREMIKTRCERGVDIARMLRLPEGAAEAIGSMEEHWDGSGMPQGLRGSAIPILGRIVCLAQTMEVFHSAFDLRTAYDMTFARRGRWFDPVLVDALSAFQMDAPFWQSLKGADTLKAVRALEPAEQTFMCGDDDLDRVAEAFARVIDAKSPYTLQHSRNVASIATAMGREMGMADWELRSLKRAALLHDVGKLGVSNTILDKPAALTPVEMETMRRHTRLTFDILKKVTRFRQFAATAAAHHERLNGEGYHLGLHGEELGCSARILAVADVTEALCANRPYRSGMGLDEAHAMVRKLVARGELCPAAHEALKATFAGFSGGCGADAAC